MRASCSSSIVVHWSARSLLLEILEMLGANEMTCCCWFFFGGWKVFIFIYIYIFTHTHTHIYIYNIYFCILYSDIYAHICAVICGSGSWRCMQYWCNIMMWRAISNGFGAINKPLSSERNIFGGVLNFETSGSFWPQLISNSIKKSPSSVTWWSSVCARVPVTFAVICRRSTTSMISNDQSVPWNTAFCYQLHICRVGFC